MSRLLRVQQLSYTDMVWAAPDGSLAEGTREPYPFYVDEDGNVQRQDFWQGTPAAVIGFTTEPERRAIDLYWRDAWREPERAVGMYVVTADRGGTWATWPLAVESLEEEEQA